MGNIIFDNIMILIMKCVCICAFKNVNIPIIFFFLFFLLYCCDSTAAQLNVDSKWRKVETLAAGFTPAEFLLPRRLTTVTF